MATSFLEMSPGGGGNEGKFLFWTTVGGFLIASMILVSQYFGISAQSTKEPDSQESDHTETGSEQVMNQSLVDLTPLTAERLQPLIDAAKIQGRMEHAEWLQEALNGSFGIYEMHFNGTSVYIMAYSEAEAQEAAQYLNQELNSLMVFSADQSAEVATEQLTSTPIHIPNLNSRLEAQGETIQYNKALETQEREINIERAIAYAQVANATLTKVHSLMLEGEFSGDLYIVGSVSEGVPGNGSDIDILIKVKSFEDLIDLQELIATEYARKQLQLTVTTAVQAQAYTSLSIPYIHFSIYCADPSEIASSIFKIPLEQ